MQQQTTENTTNIPEILKLLKAEENQKARKQKIPNNDILPITSLSLDAEELKTLEEDIKAFNNALKQAKNKKIKQDNPNHEANEAKYSNFLEGVNSIKSDLELVSLYKQLSGINGLSYKPDTLEDITKQINVFKPGLRRKSFTKELSISHNNTIIYTPPDSRTVIKNQLSNIDIHLNSKNKLTVIEIALVYYQLTAIQPFYSKNPQISRAIMNDVFSKNFDINFPIQISEQFHKNKDRHARCMRLALSDNVYMPIIRLTINCYTNAIKNLYKTINPIDNNEY